MIRGILLLFVALAASTPAAGQRMYVLSNATRAAVRVEIRYCSGVIPDGGPTSIEIQSGGRWTYVVPTAYPAEWCMNVVPPRDVAWTNASGILTFGNGPLAHPSGTYTLIDSRVVVEEHRVMVPYGRTVEVRVSFSGGKGQRVHIRRNGRVVATLSSYSSRRVWSARNGNSAPWEIDVRGQFNQNVCVAVVIVCVDNRNGWHDSRRRLKSREASRAVWGFDDYDANATYPVSREGDGDYNDAVATVRVLPAPPAPSPASPTPASPPPAPVRP